MPVHESAIQAFADDEIFKWLLKQHLGEDEAEIFARIAKGKEPTREKPKPYKKEGQMVWEDEPDVGLCCSECGSVPAFHPGSGVYSDLNYCTPCWRTWQDPARETREEAQALMTKQFGQEVMDEVALLPGRRKQKEVDERWLSQRDHIWGITWCQFQHTHFSGRRELLVKNCTPVPSTQFQGPADPWARPKFSPESMEFFVKWEDCPDFYGPRPLLVFLHGGGASREEFDLAILAYQLWWLHLVPPEMVVLIPQCRHRNMHFLQLEVKATVMSAINTAVSTGCDPHRIYVTGISKGGTAAAEWALDSSLGVLPFAASIPITPWLQDMGKARQLRSFPMWLFCGANEWRSLVERCDAFIAQAVDGGAGGETLRFTRYEWSPATHDEGSGTTGLCAEQEGHASFEQAYGEPGLWPWLLSCRRDSFTPWRPKRQIPNLRRAEQLVDNGFEEYPPDDTN